MLIRRLAASSRSTCRCVHRLRRWRARAGIRSHAQDAGDGRATDGTSASGLAVPRHTSPLIRTWFGQAVPLMAADADFVWSWLRASPGSAGSSRRRRALRG